MRPGNPRWTWLLALALVITPATSLASNHGSQQAPASSFEDIVSAFEEGDVDQAEHAYQQAFADRTEEAPWAASAIEEGLREARQADPGTAQYAWATQVAKKGVLAVSFETVQASVQADDKDRARAYFDVLATKFDGEDQLSESKQAFANLEDTTLEEALASLEAEYATLITSKVYAETAETPELLEAGEPVVAAKEAGEALGYGLSLRQTLATTQGQDTAETFREELEELGNLTLAEDTEAVRAEATEVNELLAAYALSQAPGEKTEARSAYLAAVEDGHFDEAQAVYEDTFAEEASEYAPEAHARVLEAFEAARQAEGADLVVQQQILEKSLLDIAWSVGFTELAEDEIDEGLAYLSILVDKFDDREEPGELGLALGHVAASRDAGNPALEDFRQQATTAFLDKVHEEIDEVFINWDDRETAREKAIEGLVYYHPIQDEVASTLSEEDAEHLEAELRGLYNATTAGDREEAEHEAEEAREVLKAFENAGKDVSELDQAIGEIKRTLNIITLEIEEYVEYENEGNDAKAQEEIDESKAFIGKALSTFEDNRQAFEAANAQAAEKLEADMQEIQQRLENERQIESIPDLVTQATDRLTAFEQPEGPAVDLQIGEPEPTEEGLRVPIRLLEVPEGGYSVQATLTYDAEQLTVEKVEIPAQIGAQTTSPGEVRFNAASPETGEDPVVAELYIASEGAEAAELGVNVTELTDGQGVDLQLGNVTGTSLELASSGTADIGQQIPVAGLPAIALALLGATLIVARRD